MKNRLERLFDRIDSSNDVKWRFVLRTALLNEANKINEIAKRMPDKQAKAFLRGYAFEIGKAQFFYDADSDNLTYK